MIKKQLSELISRSETPPPRWGSFLYRVSGGEIRLCILGGKKDVEKYSRNESGQRKEI